MGKSRRRSIVMCRKKKAKKRSEREVSKPWALSRTPKTPDRISTQSHAHPISKDKGNL
jgi:hypothetical protein